MNTDCFRLCVSSILAGFFLSSSALSEYAKPRYQKFPSQSEHLLSNDALRPMASEMIEFIQTQAEGLLSSLSSKGSEKNIEFLQEQVAMGLEDLEEMAQDLEQDKITANELIPTLVPLAGIVGSMAVLDENREVLEAYLKLKAFRNPTFRTNFEPLMSLAIRKDYKGMISVLNKYRVPPTSELLLEAIARGDAKQVSVLLNYGASKNIYFMLDSKDDLESKPGLQRIKTVLADFDELCGDFGSPMDRLLQEDPIISDFLYEDGIRTLHRPWSPIFVAAIAKDIETLEVLVDKGFKPFKHEQYLIGKIANQILKITEYRKVQKLGMGYIAGHLSLSPFFSAEK